MANSNSFVTYSNEAILFNLLNDSNPNKLNEAYLIEKTWKYQKQYTQS